jgi:hypothetical protein
MRALPKPPSSSLTTCGHTYESEGPLSMGRTVSYGTENPDIEAKLYSEMEQRDRWTAMILTAAGTAATKNALAGFLMRMGVPLIYKGMDLWKWRRGQTNVSE